jgi:hypothetical protein
MLSWIMVCPPNDTPPAGAEWNTSTKWHIAYGNVCDNQTNDYCAEHIPAEPVFLTRYNLCQYVAFCMNILL